MHIVRIFARLGRKITNIKRDCIPLEERRELIISKILEHSIKLREIAFQDIFKH